MYSQHYILKERYEDALLDEDVYTRIQSNEELENETSTIYTWYQDALIDQVLQDLMDEKGYTYKQAYKAVYTGGLRIYSARIRSSSLSATKNSQMMPISPRLSATG